MRNIAAKEITGNIALHLLLDVGQFLRQQTVHAFRYKEVTKDFWTLVQKLFNGKGVRFFSGSKGAGVSSDSGINLMLQLHVKDIFVDCRKIIRIC